MRRLNVMVALEVDYVSATLGSLVNYQLLLQVLNAHIWPAFWDYKVRSTPESLPAYYHSQGLVVAAEGGNYSFDADQTKGLADGV